MVVAPCAAAAPVRTFPGRRSTACETPTPSSTSATAPATILRRRNGRPERIARPYPARSQMPSGPVKIAIAGGGYGAKVPLPVYGELDEFQPVAVWSRRPQRARELAGDA